MKSVMTMIGTYNLAVTATVKDLVLANDTITGTQTFTGSSTVTLGPNLVVDGTPIIITAGTGVIFTNNTAIGGTFSAGIDPCP